MTFLFNVIGFDFHFRFNIIKKKKFLHFILLNSIDRNHHITIYCPNLTIQVNTHSFAVPDILLFQFHYRLSSY